MIVIETPRNDVINLLEKDGWVKGVWNSPGQSHCLHGAIRVCCPVPGDAFLIERVAYRRGRGTSWNDEDDRTFEDVRSSLSDEPIWDITDADLEETFGPNWARVAEIVRQAAVMTEDQAKELAAARRSVEDVAWAAARSATWVAARGVARGEAWSDASCAVGDAVGEDGEDGMWEAATSAAKVAVVGDLVGQLGLTEEHIGTLFGPWKQVFR